jgi:hypothetical protein
MARCGCSGTTCSCKIVGKGAVVVTGAGTNTNPYEITVSPALGVLDTSTVNLTLYGSGTSADPYTLSADAALNLGDLANVTDSGGAAGYTLLKQGDGSWIVGPGTTAPVGAITTTTSLDGDGSGGDPLGVRLDSLSGLEVAAGGLRISPFTVTDEAGLAAFGSAPVGSIVADTDGLNAWLKSASGWAPILEDTGTITTVTGNFVEATGWDIDEVKVRRRNGIVQMYMLASTTVNRDTGALANGNVSNIAVATLVPAEMRPVFYAGLSSGGVFGPQIGAAIGPSGNIVIGSMTANAEYPAGTQIEFNGTWIGA